MLKESILLSLAVISVLLFVSCTPQNNEEEANKDVNASNGNELTNKVDKTPETQQEITEAEQSRYKALLDSKLSGGPPPDGIPSVDEPEYLSIQDADAELMDEDKVFILEFEDKVYVYPQKILVWHEIVNLVDLNIALTYCPLTGSAITYKYPEGFDTTLGTSGALINSNLLMYDRHTGTFISQIDGIGLDNELIGHQLETIPTFWATWKQVRDKYTQAFILSESTGYIRNYDSDPYGSYTLEIANNYYTNDNLIFPANNTDTNQVFHEKYSIVGVKVNDQRLAIDKALVEKEGSIEFQLDNEDFIATYDESLSSVRITNKDASLKTPTYFEVMWFAWYAFYPETEVMQ